MAAHVAAPDRLFSLDLEKYAEREGVPVEYGIIEESHSPELTQSSIHGSHFEIVPSSDLLGETLRFKLGITDHLTMLPGILEIRVTHDVGSPPEVTDPRDGYIPVGQPYSVQIVASYRDGREGLEFQQVDTPTEWESVGAALDARTGLFTIDPSRAGLGRITLTFDVGDSEAPGAPRVQEDIELTTVPDSDMPFRRGDLNADGALDISDAIAGLSQLFLGAEENPIDCLRAADVNVDGTVDISDPIQLLNSLFLGGDPIAGSESCDAHPYNDAAGLSCRFTAKEACGG
jgi:hypothetical protein